MDFLALVKKLAYETGTELESKITTVAVPPAAVYGSTTEQRTRLINWVKDAWMEIQEDQDQWSFMIANTAANVPAAVSFALGTTVDTDYGSAIFDYLIPFVASLDRQYIWLVDTSVTPNTKSPLYFVPPERFFGLLDRQTTTSTGKPSMYTVNPDGDTVHFNCTPDKTDYQLQFNYKMLPQELAADADTPRGIKAKHHNLIVYQAMLYAAGFDESTPQYGRAKALYRPAMAKLRRDQLKDYSMAGTRT